MWFSNKRLDLIEKRLKETEKWTQDVWIRRNTRKIVNMGSHLCFSINEPVSTAKAIEMLIEYLGLEYYDGKESPKLRKPKAK